MRLDPIILTIIVKGYASGAIKLIRTLWIGRFAGAKRQQVKPDDHSEVVPLLPIPNRTVKRLCADDSADSRVKVGHCQANTENPIDIQSIGFFLLWMGKHLINPATLVPGNRS